MGYAEQEASISLNLEKYNKIKEILRDISKMDMTESIDKIWLIQWRNDAKLKALKAFELLTR